MPLHPELERWLAAAFAEKSGEFVFPGFAGKQSGAGNGLSSRFSALMKRAGIKPHVTEGARKKGRDRLSHSFNSLRHSFNSAMANAGIAQEIRQRLTGHASKAVNDIYTHTELETLQRAVAAVPTIS
jgi:site-specific recombinase XerD